MVEDELGLQRLIRRRAEQEQLEVMTALTIADGLSLCRTGRPDLIVLDLHLPDGQGIEMLRRLKSDPQTAKIPIVAWSGSGDVSEEDDILLAGADAYCSKLDLRALFVTILELLRRVAGVPGN
ncbi:MAG TPA: response regulator [Polyangiaceae bacterium]|nr:response regulator [Polyangiaceae bacterium]